MCSDLGDSMMSGFDCTTCGRHHDELPMCLGSPAPELWFSIPEEEREKRAVLSSDQCVITDHPLSIEQRRGISLARVQSIVERALHG